MFASFRKFLVVAPLFVFGAVGFAQTSNIQGDVTGFDGKPAVGATIKIDRTDIKSSFNVKTDKKGHFLYANLPMGLYTITLIIEGKESGTMAGLRPKQGDNPPLVFDLAKAAATAAASAAATATPAVTAEVAAPGSSDVNLLPGLGGAGAQPLRLTLPQSQSQRPTQSQPKQAGMTKEQQAALQAENERKLKEREELIAKTNALNGAFNAGMEAKNAKNYPVAIENFEKAGAQDPTQHVVWAQLGDTYMILGESKSGAERQESFDKGIAAYAKAVELKANEPNYHNNYALALAKAKKMDQAQAELTKAAELDPPQAGKYYYNLGAAYVNTQQNDAAEVAFKKSYEVDPTYADAYFQEGVVLMNKVTLDKAGKMQAPPGAAEAFQKYLELKPDGPNAEAAKAILEQLGSTVQTSFDRAPATKQPAKSNQKKSK